MNDLEVYAGSALVGVLAGMRSMSAPAVLGQLNRKGALVEVTGTLDWVRHRGFITASSVLAVGEMIADKLPITPNRTAAGPLMGRALAGGLSGAVICSAKRRSVLAGAFIGAAAAVGMAYGAFMLRKQLGQKLHIPDAAMALAEDAIVGAGGVALVSRLSGQEE